MLTEVSQDWFVLIVALVVGASLCGAAANLLLALKDVKGHHPRYWVVGMMISSYCLIIPGLVLNLFKTDIYFELFGQVKQVSDRSENMFELVEVMFGSGLYLGACFVTLYAMVIPAVKVLLLILGEVWRHKTETVARARWCISFVQMISKWASPDMFCYILMAYLFRSMDNPPNLRSDMRLGLGFTCFCVFCIGSTISTLGISLPSIPHEVAEKPARPWFSLPRRLFAPVVALLFVAFVVLLFIGVHMNCMELHLDMELLYQKKPALRAVRSIIDGLGLPELMHQQVSVLRCIAGQSEWVFGGDLNCALAVIMYAVFAVAMPVADVVTLAIAAWHLRCGEANEMGARALWVSKKLRKISMLDVSIMGVFVVVLSLKDMRKNGVVIGLCPGIIAQVGAEICHYVFAYVVGAAYSDARELPIVQKTVTGKDEVASADSNAPNDSEVDIEASTTDVSLELQAKEDNSEVSPA